MFGEYAVLILFYFMYDKKPYVMYSYVIPVSSARWKIFLAKNALSTTHQSHNN